MRQTDWTPGPWIAAPSGERMLGYAQSWGVGSHEGRNLIAGCFYDGIGGTDVAEANARLIAKAPEMAEMVKELLEELRLIRMKDCAAVYDPTVRVRAQTLLNELGPR